MHAQGALQQFACHKGIFYYLALIAIAFWVLDGISFASKRDRRLSMGREKKWNRLLGERLNSWGSPFNSINRYGTINNVTRYLPSMWNKISRIRAREVALTLCSPLCVVRAWTGCLRLFCKARTVSVIKKSSVRTIFLDFVQYYPQSKIRN